MKARIFNQDVVRHIMDGTQTQFRRPLKVQPLTSKSKLITLAETTDRDERKYEGWNYWAEVDGLRINRDTQSRYFKPRHKPGDIIGVRERVRLMNKKVMFGGMFGEFKYEADNYTTGWVPFPKRTKFMASGHCVPNGCFKELIRTFLKVTGIRFERFCDISEPDAIAEGISVFPLQDADDKSAWWQSSPGVNQARTPIASFKKLIESIYPGQWNSWCEVTEFEKCDKPKEL